MKRFVKHFNGVQWTILGLLTVLTLYFENLATPMGLISAAAGITGIMCVLEVGEGRESNYYWGIVNVALYAFMAFSAKLYGDFMLNAFYYFPAQFVGIYLWRKHRTNDGQLEAKLMSWKQRGILAVSCIIAVAAYSKLLQVLGGNVPIIDATSTVFSIIAMMLMIKRYAEQWTLWIIVNVVSIIMWIFPLLQGEQGAIAMVLMWSGYLANAIYGYINWKKMAKEN